MEHAKKNLSVKVLCWALAFVLAVTCGVPASVWATDQDAEGVEGAAESAKSTAEITGEEVFGVAEGVADTASGAVDENTSDSASQLTIGEGAQNSSVLSVGAASTPDPATLKVVQAEYQGCVVLTEDGSLWLAADEDNSGNIVPRSTPYLIMGDVASVCGPYVIKKDGTVWSYVSYDASSGKSLYGGSSLKKKMDGKVIQLLSAKQPYSGYWALKGDGSLWALEAYNSSTNKYDTTPRKLLTNVKSVEFGRGSLCAIRKDGALRISHDYGGSFSNVLDGVASVSVSQVPTALKTNGQLMELEFKYHVIASNVKQANGQGYVKNDGTFWMWDYVPTAPEDGVYSRQFLTGVKEVGDDMVLKSDGTAWSLSSDIPDGTVGADVLNDKSTKMVKVLDNVAALQGVFAIKKDGSLWGPSMRSNTGMPYKKILDNVKSVHYGSLSGEPSHTITNDGSLYYLGYSSNGTTLTWKTTRITPFASKTNIATATVSGVSNQTFTGKAITPKPTVKLGGKTLKEGTDYTVSYKNNVNVGTATVTVTGKGSYTGTVSKTFKITRPSQIWFRLWGNTQFDTMAKVVQAGWKKNAGGTVILATAVNFPDALSASGVAGLFGAPVLLTNKASLPAQTKAELARIKPSRVIIAGGPGAIKTSVDAQVKAACGVRPTRCYGSTASDTAAKLATTYVKKRSDTAILATSKFFYDSLSAAPVAYAKHYPILLADSKDAVSKNTLSAMKSCGIKKVIIVGGTSVIGPKIVSQLKANGISVAERLGGRTYYDTSRLIAQWALANGMSANRMGVATSYKFYDALTGASLCGKNNAVLVLADDKGRANASVAKANKSKISQGYVFGGVNAVGEATFDGLEAATK